MLFRSGLEYGAGNPNIPAWVEVRNTMVEHLVSALNGQSTAEEALQAAEEAVNKVLSQ